MDENKDMSFENIVSDEEVQASFAAMEAKVEDMFRNSNNGNNDQLELQFTWNSGLGT